MLRACLTCIDPRILPPEFAGRRVRPRPALRPARRRRPVRRERRVPLVRVGRPDVLPLMVVEAGERVTRDGFVFADVVPVEPVSQFPVTSCQVRERLKNWQLETGNWKLTTDDVPHRIVCLTQETTETLYLLGQGHGTISVCRYTVRPPEARSKPRISWFPTPVSTESKRCTRIFVLAFSDTSGGITGELIKRGYAVFTFNQRSIDEESCGSAVPHTGQFRVCRQRDHTRRRVQPGPSRALAKRPPASAPASSLLRGMGRSPHLRDPLGRGAGGNCRRRSGISHEAERRAAGEGAE